MRARMFQVKGVREADRWFCFVLVVKYKDHLCDCILVIE